MMWILGCCWGCDRLRKTSHVIHWSSPHLPAQLLPLKICSPPPRGALTPHLFLAGRTTGFPLLYLLWLMITQHPPPPLDPCHLWASQCCGHTSIAICLVTKVCCCLHNNSFHMEKMSLRQCWMHQSTLEDWKSKLKNVFLKCKSTWKLCVLIVADV